MNTNEREALRQKIDLVARERIPDRVLKDIDVSFGEDHLGDASVFIVLHMKSGYASREYADAMTSLSDALMTVTDTSDGFLFPYISPRIEDEAA